MGYLTVLWTLVTFEFLTPEKSGTSGLDATSLFVSFAVLY